MKYKLTEVIKDYEGKDIPLEAGSKDSPALTYKQVVVTALNTEIQGKIYLPDQKVKAFFITKKAYEPDTEGKVEYTADEVSFLLTKIIDAYLPLVVGRCEEFFNQKEISPTDEASQSN